MAIQFLRRVAAGIPFVSPATVTFIGRRPNTVQNAASEPECGELHTPYVCHRLSHRGSVQCCPLPSRLRNDRRELTQNDMGYSPLVWNRIFRQTTKVLLHQWRSPWNASTNSPASPPLYPIGLLNFSPTDPGPEQPRTSCEMASSDGARDRIKLRNEIPPQSRDTFK